MRLWLLLLVWMCDRSLFCCRLRVRWKHRDDHNNTQKSTRGVYECTCVCLEHDEPTGSEFRFSPRRTTLPLWMTPRSYRDGGRLRQDTENDSWRRKKRQPNQKAKAKKINTVVVMKHTVFPSIWFPNVFSICFSHTYIKEKVNLWPLSSPPVPCSC